ncbi:MAG TPA: hypothetical protein VNM90_19435 [Haliangium sp.]|nr:hypothetical protein [Haliangium sp.]
MPMVSRHVLAAAAAVLMAGSGLLWAQPGRAPGQPAPDESYTSGESAGPASQTRELSPQEMIADAERLANEIQLVRGEIVTLQTEARDKKDMIRLDCIDDKLAQIDQLSLIVEAARADLGAAVASGDLEGRLHHHGLVAQSREKATAVRQEADGCIGEEMRFPGNADIDVTDPGLDDPTRHAPFELADKPMLDRVVEEPTEPIWEEEVVIERPGYATPFI